MKELFMKVLWMIADKSEVEGLNLYKTGSYADMDILHKGKRYNISIREKDEEEK